MPESNPVLIFDGTTADAMRFYERALNGKVEMMMTEADVPGADRAPSGNGAKIVYSLLKFDGGTLAAMDAPAGEPYEGMRGFSVSLAYPTVAAARRVFDSLARDGQVTMPFGKTFWAEGFGMLVDRFGTPWMIGTQSVETPQ